MKLKILGPPGTGKTTRLMEYLEKELEQGTPPNRLAFLTFTRAARLEVLARTKKTEKDFPYMKTIHSTCYHQLAIGRDQIVRVDNLRSFGWKLGVKLTGATHDPWLEEFDRGNDPPTRDDMLLSANHNGRHRKIMLKEALQNLSLEIDFKYATWFTNAYREWKKANGLLDYTDLLSRFSEYGRPLEIDCIFIDEAQDLSLLQWETVFRLGSQAKRWYIAGDDDQAIFHWAGADGSIFQDLEVDKVEILNQSFRVCKSVHSLANRISSRIVKRLEKNYKSTESTGSVENIGYLGGLDLNHKTFILFRNHYRGALISEVLRNEKIPFIGKGSVLTDPEARTTIFAWYEIFKKGETGAEGAKRLVRYCDGDYINPMLNTMLSNPSNLHRTYSINEVFLDLPKLEEWHTVISDLPNKDVVGDYIRRFGFIKTAIPKIEIMSIHQSKGREAHTVILDSEMSKASWSGLLTNPDDEHRVWYVGITRAKERVQILLPDGPYCYRF